MIMQQHHQDMQQWRFVQGEAKPLTIGTKVRLPFDHEFKSDWPDEYFVVGLNIEPSNGLNITISDSLDGAGDSADGWRVVDFIAV
jgi:hypothetical protein